MFILSCPSRKCNELQGSSSKKGVTSIQWGLCLFSFIFLFLFLLYTRSVRSYYICISCRCDRSTRRRRRRCLLVIFLFIIIIIAVVVVEDYLARNVVGEDACLAPALQLLRASHIEFAQWHLEEPQRHMHF